MVPFTYSNPTSTALNITLPTAAPSNAVLGIGLIYECYHYSPLFGVDSLEQAKRFTKYYGYYKNDKRKFLFSDLNTTAGQTADSLVSAYKQTMDVNVAFIYEDTDGGYYTADLYRQRDLTWDSSVFDITPSELQSNDFIRLEEPLLGTGYALQVVNHNRSVGGFELVGYQVVAKTGQRNSRYWST
jgi:hypothetical protein